MNNKYDILNSHCYSLNVSPQHSQIRSDQSLSRVQLFATP